MWRKYEGIENFFLEYTSKHFRNTKTEKIRPYRHFKNCYLISEFTEEDLEDAFQKREVKAKSSKKAASQLSKQLVESHGKPNNPFLEYSKFDGEVNPAF